MHRGEYYVQKETILRRSVMYRNDIVVKHINFVRSDIHKFAKKSSWSWALKLTIL